jgi:hypothetical protein
LKPPEADEAAGEGEEGFVDVVAAVVADKQPLVVVQPGEGALNGPAGASESGAVFGLAAPDQGRDAALAEDAAVPVVVVAAIGEQAVGSLARPTGLAAHRRHALKQRDQLRHVVAVAAGDGPGQRQPARL